jgi:hypothetical protein
VGPGGPILFSSFFCTICKPISHCPYRASQAPRAKNQTCSAKTRRPRAAGRSQTPTQLLLGDPAWRTPPRRAVEEREAPNFVFR